MLQTTLWANHWSNRLEICITCRWQSGLDNGGLSYEDTASYRDLLPVAVGPLWHSEWPSNMLTGILSLSPHIFSIKLDQIDILCKGREDELGKHIRSGSITSKSDSDSGEFASFAFWSKLTGFWSRKNQRNTRYPKQRWFQRKSMRKDAKIVVKRWWNQVKQIIFLFLSERVCEFRRVSQKRGAVFRRPPGLPLTNPLQRNLYGRICSSLARRYVKL